ncbi:RiPP maturation radical SAM C-methyltransferase [Nonomuraea sp. B10E15]|uniref:RiPP maturation radical SAM C-methyltransferase n=1 Tax=Nonomuraea sp. B10E15 TaxID=3153560 RepID=UPI00325DA8B9
MSMPWAQLDLPSLALGVLTSVCERTACVERVDVEYANLAWYEFLAERLEYAPDRYEVHSLHSYFSGAGDWIFSSALNGVDWNTPDFAAYAESWGLDVDECVTLHRLAPEFIDLLAERIARTCPDVVGVSSVFQQNIASLALARALKRLKPDLITVFGGANCDGVMGEAVARNFDFVDYVVRGEGEEALPRLLEGLHRSDPSAVSAVPGLVGRHGGELFANPMRSGFVPPGRIPRPDFDAFFERFAGSRVAEHHSPKLVLEASRGCWWGERHHCTFCGLNGSMMTFRSKSPESFVDELVELAERHQCLNVYAVDNILDQAYIGTAMTDLAARDLDLHVMFEVKANLRRDDLRTLKDAGVVCVQPGIENLSSRVLRLMDKGVSGAQCVRFLRDADELGMTVLWNYLYGFPGEQDRDYTDVLESAESLVHLPPPGYVGRILLERFSPYFNDPALGLPNRGPHSRYRISYDLPLAELDDLAYVFRSQAQGIAAQPDVAGRVSGFAEYWRKVFPESSLVHYSRIDGSYLIANSRPNFAWSTHILTDPVEKALYAALDAPRRRREIARRVGASETEVESLLSDWTERGLCFTDDSGLIVRLSTAGVDPANSRVEVPS